MPWITSQSETARGGRPALNGKGFPATPAYAARRGERVRFRFLNYGALAHPIHLHGLTFEVFARDGYVLSQPFRCDTLTIAPFERWDAIVVADNPGGPQHP